MGDPMPLDHAPDTIRPGIIRRSLIHKGGPADGERAENQPWPHHPTHISEPEHRFTGAQVEEMSHILRPLKGKPGMIMNRALGFAGRTGGINEHERIHAVHRLRLDIIGAMAAPNRFIPRNNSISVEIPVHTAYG